VNHRTYHRFELVAAAEGASFVLLLAVAMPLKYLAGIPEPTRVIGLLHGLAFLAYEAQVIDAVVERRWHARTAWLGALAGLLPLATFAFIAHLRRRARSVEDRVER
jgi:integral membrane protein